MTLPQHLEPFLFRENPSLSYALKAADPSYSSASDVEGALADVFLSIVANGTCQVFCDRILSICELTLAGGRQLSHDISNVKNPSVILILMALLSLDYLGNVLEDLGLSLSESLKQLAQLLKIPSDQYQTQSAGCSARYVAAVRQMRNITSAGAL